MWVNILAGDPRLTDNVRLQALETFNDKPDFFPPDSRITYSSPPPTDGPGEQVRNGGVYLGEFNLRNGEGTEGIVLVAIIEPMLFLDAAAVAMRITSSTGFQPVTYDDVGKPYRAGERVLNNETVIASLNMLHGANIQQCRNPELQKILTNSRWFLSSSETNQPNQVWAFNFWSNGILAQKKETHPMRAMLVRLATPSQQAATL